MPVEYEPFEIFGRALHYTPVCDACLAADAARRKEEMAIKSKARRRSWFEAITPPLYRETRCENLLPAFKNAVESWEVDESIALVGYSGSGKTRTGYLLLEKAAMEGFSIQVANLATFQTLVLGQFSDNPGLKRSSLEKLDSLMSAHVILLDDLGKTTFSDRVETELYNLLEHRTAHHKITIWTSNSEKMLIRSKLSDDRAEPILRRLLLNTKVVKV